jgi:hypothetical protein
MKRSVLALSIAAVCSLTAAALQGPPAGGPPLGAPPPGGRGPQQPPSVAAIEVEKVRDNLYVLNGGGSNSTVFITANNGVVVIDTKLSRDANGLIAVNADCRLVFVG